jgi:hypothetical protein
MDHNTFRGLIYGSTRADWLYDDDKGIFTLKSNLNITIRILRDDEDRSFTEPWHSSLPDPSATRSIHELYYGASYVGYEFIVNVDGGRASIPLPEDGHTAPWITRDQHSFGRIVDRGGQLDDYLRRCKITVK